MIARGVDFTGIAYLVGFALVAAAGVYVYRNRAAIVQSINPTDQNNLANRAVGSMVVAATGGAANGGEDSLGGVAARVREWLSGDDKKIRDMLKGSPAAPSANDSTWQDRLEQVW